jgi:hypothetical protein
MNTSPGWKRCHAWITAFTASGIEPRWIGRSGPCATISPLTSKSPHE